MKKKNSIYNTSRLEAHEDANITENCYKHEHTLSGHG